MPSYVQCAAVLAGGLSSRMGQEKALLPFAGQPLIAHTSQFLRPLFHRVVVVTSNREVAEAAQLPSLADEFAGQGPLAGIHAALKHFDEPTFVVACDMPYLNRDFIETLCAQVGTVHRPDAIVPLSGPDTIQPLHAIYLPSGLPTIERLLGDKTRTKAPSIRFALSKLQTEFVDAEVAKRYEVHFENWNTPDDIRASD